MIARELRRKTDRVWDAFWPDGAGNMLDVAARILHHNKQTVLPEALA